MALSMASFCDHLLIFSGNVCVRKFVDIERRCSWVAMWSLNRNIPETNTKIYQLKLSLGTCHNLGLICLIKRSKNLLQSLISHMFFNDFYQESTVALYVAAGSIIWISEPKLAYTFKPYENIQNSKNFDVRIDKIGQKILEIQQIELVIWHLPKFWSNTQNLIFIHGLCPILYY